MKRKKLYPILAALMSICMLSSCSQSGGDNDLLTVPVGKFGEHEIRDAVTYNGTIEVSNPTPYVVSTNIDQYRVKKIYVKVGKSVKKGDLICEFDTDDLNNQIKEIESKLESSNAYDERSLDNLRKQLQGLEEMQKIKLDGISEKQNKSQQLYNEAEQKFNNAQANYNNAYNLYNDAEANLKNASSSDEISYYSGLCTNYQNQVSQYSSEMEQYKSAMTSAREIISSSRYDYDIEKLEYDRQIGDLKYQIESYKSESNLKEKLDELKKTLNESVIYAEHDGIVNEVNISEGQSCSEKNLVSILNDDSRLIHTVLNDSDVVAVKEGMKVELVSPSDLIDSMTGVVSKINKIKGEKGFDVYISSDELDDINIGMNISSSIIIFNDTVDSVYRKSIRKKIEGEGNYVLVAVPKSNDTYVLESRDVVVGASDDNYAQIVEGDIKEGEWVVATDLPVIYDGLDVRILDYALMNSMKG